MTAGAPRASPGAPGTDRQEGRHRAGRMARGSLPGRAPARVRRRCLADVQALRRRGTARAASRLPEPRSDTSAVTIGGTAYLLGGYDGASYDPTCDTISA